jgi:cytochrome b561
VASAYFCAAKLAGPYHAINGRVANNPPPAPVLSRDEAEAEMDARAQAADNYDAVLKAVHWTTLLLIVAIFAAAWIAHSGMAGDYYQPVMQLHRSLGLTVAVLTIFRRGWRLRAEIPRLPSDLPVPQKLAARVTEGAIYGLLIAQPLLGLIHTNARSQRVDLYFLGQLPAVIGPDKALGRLTHDLHGLVANALLVVIGLHAAAALFHHFIRRDRVLLTMLPARLHSVLEHLRCAPRRGTLAAPDSGGRGQ